MKLFGFGLGDDMKSLDIQISPTEKKKKTQENSTCLSIKPSHLSQGTPRRGLGAASWPLRVNKAILLAQRRVPWSFLVIFKCHYFSTKQLTESMMAIQCAH